ncbi:MAG TPA: GntR family transcriptional regulator [Mycobacterium sp.]|nr:GntR family transcriptional regulator [Actinomycetota bacterium]HQC77868.1 GntR family transcriptional regulator [Mycobacterium sp.]
MLQLGQIDRADDKPPYRQIATMLRDAISSGQFRAGERLPSEWALTDHLGVARMTVRRAVDELRTEGLLISEHGRGVFVRTAPPVHRITSDRFARQSTAAEESDNSPHFDSIAVTLEKANSTVAEHLRLTPGDDVIVRSQRHLADGRPVEITASYIPAALARATRLDHTDIGDGGVHARLEDAGHLLARFTEEVGARMPTPDERRALHLAAGPVLTVTRTAYDTNDIAVEVCEEVKVASAYLLEYHVPAR